jgi:hypothetical protein
MPSNADSPSEQLADLLWATRDDPDLFNSAVLGRPGYWWRQVEICHALARYKTVVVPTGNSVGKSYLAGGLPPWWLLTRPGSQVVCTAPSQNLLGTVLFKELRRAVGKSRIPLGGTITDSPKASPQTWLLDNQGWECLGIATKGVERLSGQHNADLLQIIDEGSGIEPEIAEALDSQNPAKRVVFGNPLWPDGWFNGLYKRALREQHDPRIPDAERCVAIRVASTDSPDIDLLRSPRGLADRSFITEAERTYGRDSLYWVTHVLGMFPDASHDGLLKEYWVDRLRTVGRPEGVNPGRRRMAVDLGYGTENDRGVILIRDDLGVPYLEQSNRMGVPETAARMAHLSREWGVRQEDMVYDANGPGRDLPRYLEQHDITEAVPYHGSGKGGAKAANKRSKCGWRLRQRLDPERPVLPPKADDGGRKPSLWDAEVPPPPARPQHPFRVEVPDGANWWPSLREELLALRYRMNGIKVELEKKEDMAKRLGRSPDLVDALLMSFAAGDDE